MKLFALLLILSTSASAKESLIGTKVQSDSWNVKRSKGNQKETFKGNVRYNLEDRAIQADRATYDHASKVATATGRIKARQGLNDGRVFHAEGHQSKHDRTDHKGWLKPRKGKRVGLRLVEPDGLEGKGSAGSVTWDGTAKTITLEKEVEYADPRGSLAAEWAVYDDQTRSLALEGRRPVLHGVEKTWAGAVQADRIVASEVSEYKRRVVAEGKTSGWFHFPEKDKYKSQDPR